ncbi:hypothetical protein ACIGW8_02070 [Streptomyces sioyaensis]|uniref:hypothetical protein n=1 Tax=Streptomyces sioyaensis TaxID=67364 RepID=UPI0037CE6BE3
MAPWIAVSVLVGPGRYEPAVGIAVALAVALVIVGRVRPPGTSFKILEVSDVVFFAVMAVIGHLRLRGHPPLAGELLRGNLEYRAAGDRPRIHGGPGAVHPAVRPGTGAP